MNVNETDAERMAGTVDHRRDCLRGIVGWFLFLAVELPVHAVGAPFTGRELESWLRDANLELLGSRTMLRGLGAEYLAQNPQESDVHKLSMLLGTDGSAPFDRRLRERISQEWLDLDTAVADGWVLSRTEARLCAVLHMTEDLRG